MPATIDILSPVYVGNDKIRLSVAPDSGTLLPWVPITLDVVYTDADPSGIELPLVFTVQPGDAVGGEARGYQRKTYSRNAPDTLTFRVPAAGTYLVTLKERFHNRWQGRLVITVAGDPFGEDIVRERS
jgi:hypothetical protein